MATSHVDIDPGTRDQLGSDRAARLARCTKAELLDELAKSEQRLEDAETVNEVLEHQRRQDFDRRIDLSPEEIDDIIDALERTATIPELRPFTSRRMVALARRLRARRREVPAFDRAIANLAEILDAGPAEIDALRTACLELAAVTKTDPATAVDLVATAVYSYTDDQAKAEASPGWAATKGTIAP